MKKFIIFLFLALLSSVAQSQSTPISQSLSSDITFSEYNDITSVKTINLECDLLIVNHDYQANLDLDLDRDEIAEVINNSIKITVINKSSCNKKQRKNILETNLSQATDASLKHPAYTLNDPGPPPPPTSPPNGGSPWIIVTSWPYKYLDPSTCLTIEGDTYLWRSVGYDSLTGNLIVTYKNTTVVTTQYVTIGCDSATIGGPP